MVFHIAIPDCKLFYLEVKNISAVLQFDSFQEEIKPITTFNLECFNCSQRDTNYRRYSVYLGNITFGKKLSVVNLQPATNYALRVIPWIHVTDGKQAKTKCEAIIFRTLDGG